MELTEATKKYWPWAVGGIAVLWLMNKNGSSGGGSGYVIDYAGMAAANAQAAQVASNAQMQQAQIAAMEKQGEREHQYNLESIALQREKLAAEAEIGFISAQSAAAQGVGSAAADLIAGLSMPSINAVNAAADENAATLMAAALAVQAGFEAQSYISAVPAQTVMGMGEAMAASNSFMWQEAGRENKGRFERLGGMAIRGYSAYASGGMSEMGRGG